MPSTRRVSALLLLATLPLAACAASPPEDSAEGGAWERRASAATPETEDALREGIDLYLATRTGQLTFTTDPGERREHLINAFRLLHFTEQGDFDTVFILGDEAFEAELDHALGLGVGPAPEPGLPARPRRLQRGEVGGLDSSSCRSCHFSGGADGGGTLTQVALLRGDGVHLSTATVRDSPHVMGLGYISIVAADLNDELQGQLARWRAAAAERQEPVTEDVFAGPLSFGRITVFPDGSVDGSALDGISPDLLVRPFGHKGRHVTLVEVVDEALQLHHGLQSASRIETFADDPTTWLGDGPVDDPDHDGIRDEVTEAQAVLLSSYLSMLGIPEIRPPRDPELALAWARGRRLMTDIGCTSCHLAELRFDHYDLAHTAAGSTGLTVELDLLDAGQDPKPRRLDYGNDDDGRSPSGIPFYPYTDLKRHRMGPALADPVGEVLPGEVDVVPGDQWLTRSLWGLADTAPYLHDGRAPTVHDAIVAHGGDAAPPRDAYLALPAREQGALRVFLMSLTRSGAILVE